MSATFQFRAYFAAPYGMKGWQCSECYALVGFQTNEHDKWHEKLDASEPVQRAARRRDTA